MDSIENDESNVFSIFVCICCRENVFTEPLPIKYKGDTQIDPQIFQHTDRMQNDASNNSSIVPCISSRGNVLIEPLPNTEWKEILNRAVA
jgi:hypothetical protein